MNDDLYFQYMFERAGMRPEEMELMRKQKMIDALRGQSMEGPQGQMIGKHYVPPSLTQYAAQLGQGYMAARGQDQQKKGMEELMGKQTGALDRIRAEIERRRRMQESGGMGPSAMYQGSILPYGDGPAY